jgi:RNase PH-related exoribonuclease
MSVSKSEKSYIQVGLLSNPPLRADGRSLRDFRTIALETGPAPLANGSARLNMGRNPHDGGGGTEVLAAVKLESENIQDEGVEGGRIVCTVSWFVFSIAWFGFIGCGLNEMKIVLLQLIHIYRLELWMTSSMT